MEVMEDGNLMDKVNILIQRDMEYYKAKQSVLQETVCSGIIGGRLDFPRSASFAAIKLVIWWEEEYVAAYRKPSGFFQKNTENSRENSEGSGACGGMVRSSDPAKFVTSLSRSSDQLLEHLHVLTQEALDHADLTVLTGTIGAAALIKNCLWFFMQILSDVKSLSISCLQAAYKKYMEMCEALAERLLDLHCRLLSLYILQDADCLDWENHKPFFESERGSYVIQMWWIYMQGTKDDLWNTVPPKMAQRVFSGMLNESLTILTVRYIQSSPSEARSELLLVDLSNLLLCIAQLLPSICESSEELINTGIQKNKSKILRDIHVKSQELFWCFLLRGASLDTLQKIFKNGLQTNNENSKKISTSSAPATWIKFSLPNIFKNFHLNEKKENCIIAMDLMVLLSQPQLNWALLLKILCSSKLKVLSILFNEFMTHSEKLKRVIIKSVDCGNLLCPADGSCKSIETTSRTLNSNQYYELIISTLKILFHVGNDEEIKELFIDVMKNEPEWSACFERRHVWNQIRPSWFEAIINIASSILPLVEETVINALQTGATMYQAMSLIIACFSQYWEMLDSSLLKVSNLLQEVIPSNVTPVSNSVLMQILISALYTNLIRKSENLEKEVQFHVEETYLQEQPSTSSRRPSYETVSSAALAAAESLCSIDEDNKHTDQIEEFLKQINEAVDETASILINCGAENLQNDKKMIELVVSDLLMTIQGKRSLKMLFHFIKNNSEWLYWKLGVSERKETEIPNRVIPLYEPLLHKVFHIGYQPFDQLLTKELQPNWQNLLQQSKSGLTLEKVWINLLSRWEFQNSSSSPKLSQHETEIVNNLTLTLKP